MDCFYAVKLEPTLDAETEEDKHLDAQHVIEEAMSKFSPSLTYSIPIFSNSAGTHAQLSKVPEMYVDFSTESNIILTYWFPAFIKEMGVSVDGVFSSLNIWTYD